MATGLSREAFETDAAPPSYGHRAQAVTAAGFLFTGGVIGVGHPDRAAEGAGRPAGDLAAQVALCLRHMDAVTTALGGERGRVVEVSAFVAQAGGQSVVAPAVREFLGAEPPLWHYQEVADVAGHGLIETDWIVALDRTVPLSEAVETIRPLGDLATGDQVVPSGPFAITNGVMGHGPTMAAATENAVEAMAARLGSVGATLDAIAKMVVYIDSFDRYPEFNSTTKRLLDLDPLPTRSVLVAPEVTGEAAVRVDLIAER